MMSEEPKSVIDTRPKVAVTCTTTGSLRFETAAALMRTMQDSRYRITMSLMNDRPYESALNVAAKLVIDNGFHWWLHIDSDQHWMGNPLDAVDHDVDLVSFPAPLYHLEGSGSPVICFNAWRVPDKEDRTKVIAVQCDGNLQEVDVIASGAFLIRVSALRDASIPAPFARRYDADGVMDRGCDVEFCRKWQEAGLLVHADFGSLCGHRHNLDLLEVMQDMGAKIPPRL